MGTMGRGRGCNKGCLELPQGGDRSRPFSLCPMGYAFPIRCHDRGEYPAWPKTRASECGAARADELARNGVSLPPRIDQSRLAPVAVKIGRRREKF